jgi:3-hydroxyisobutyrate dehydrogenase-like beta-hydroxyacid dehydrogenase
MATRLVAAGHDILACDLRPELGGRFREAGGRVAATVADVAAECAVVLASLPTPQAVEKVALGEGGIASGGAVEIFVDLSTTGPAVSKQVGAALGEKGILAIDAPVSGGVHGAGKGALSIMASGQRSAFDRVEGLLSHLGKNVFYVGPEAGMGQMVKLINNMLSATALAATCEALAVAIKAGLDPDVVLSVLNKSTGKSSATEHKVPECVLPGKPIGFGLDLSFKDISLFVKEGEGLQVPMWSGNLTRQIWQHALSTGGPDQDMMGVAQCIEKWAGVRLYGARPAN